MRPETTPERVLSVIRFIETGPQSQETVQKYCELRAILPQVNEREEIRDSLSVAIELGLVELKNKIYTYIGPESITDSYITFRRFVAQKAFTINPAANFYKATQWYINSNNEIAKFKNLQEYAADMTQKGFEDMNHHHARGWLLWLRFLGLLIYNNFNTKSMSVIPNMYVRLKDKMRELKPNTKIPCNKFLKWLLDNLPELKDCIKDNTLPLCVSNGLRTMENLKEIEMVAVGDAERLKLYPIKGIALKDFSSIKIKEAIQNELE